MKNLRFKKVLKDNLLTENKQFRKDIRVLRIQLNAYRIEMRNSNLTKADDFAHDISINFKQTMSNYNVNYTTVCQILRLSPHTIYKVLKDYPLFPERKDNKPQSFLVDRQHYARLIVDGVKTRQEIAKQTGYKYSTVAGWVYDYKRYGNKMTNQAIAFRREL